MARKYNTRKAKAISGRMFPYVDVSTNDKKKVNTFLDMIKSGRTIIVLVYANWCGHCHTFKPIFDKAASAGNTKVAAAIESEALSTINASLPKPISVEGYPTVIAIGDKGNQIAEMSTPMGSDAVTQLKNVMKNLNSIKKPEVISEKEKNVFSNSFDEATQPITVLPESDIIIPMNENLSITKQEDQIIDARRNQVGGSLYAALGAAAVQLAPSGILLSIHSMMKNRKSKKTRKVKKNRR